MQRLLEVRLECTFPECPQNGLCRGFECGENALDVCSICGCLDQQHRLLGTVDTWNRKFESHETEAAVSSTGGPSQTSKIFTPKHQQEVQVPSVSSARASSNTNKSAGVSSFDRFYTPTCEPAARTNIEYFLPSLGPTSSRGLYNSGVGSSASSFLPPQAKNKAEAKMEVNRAFRGPTANSNASGKKIAQKLDVVPTVWLMRVEGQRIAVPAIEEGMLRRQGLVLDNVNFDDISGLLYRLSGTQMQDQFAVTNQFVVFLLQGQKRWSRLFSSADLPHYHWPTSEVISTAKKARSIVVLSPTEFNPEAPFDSDDTGTDTRSEVGTTLVAIKQEPNQSNPSSMTAVGNINTNMPAAGYVGNNTNAAEEALKTLRAFNTVDLTSEGEEENVDPPAKTPSTLNVAAESGSTARPPVATPRHVSQFLHVVQAQEQQRKRGEEEEQEALARALAESVAENSGMEVQVEGSGTSGSSGSSNHNFGEGTNTSLGAQVLRGVDAGQMVQLLQFLQQQQQQLQLQLQLQQGPPLQQASTSSLGNVVEMHPCAESEEVQARDVSIDSVQQEEMEQDEDPSHSVEVREHGTAQSLQDAPKQKPLPPITRSAANANNKRGAVEMEGDIAEENNSSKKSKKGKK